MSPERERALHKLRHLRGILDTIEIALKQDAPPGHEGAQAITQEATALAMTLARIDVVERMDEANITCGATFTYRGKSYKCVRKLCCDLHKDKSGYEWTNRFAELKKAET